MAKKLKWKSALQIGPTGRAGPKDPRCTDSEKRPADECRAGELALALWRNQ
jgi:hypothetical protein